MSLLDDSKRIEVRQQLRKSLRSRLIAAREALDPFEHQRFSDALGSHVERLLQHLRPATISFYWPFRNEPDLTQIVAKWLAEDDARRAALPVVAEAGQTLSFLEWRPGMDL
ncbi:MAG TPA: 5-formyltetrahydrofolate cyclo-ligase, partial [Rhodocyclaceae bacterium]|nr:5-formyltetrahydrofolate cyclo-ligase [Rhodocyclaceae bacterium]